jgi:flagellar assembly factor FliW
MLEVTTRHFGLVSCQDEAVLQFPLGLPAFENATRFVLIEEPATSPVVFLQSLNAPDLCFVLLPIRIVDPNYRLSLCIEDAHVLGLPENAETEIGPDVACFSILSLVDDRPPTANLLAPIVLHVPRRLGVQSVRLDTAYSHQHPLRLDGASCS